MTTPILFLTSIDFSIKEKLNGKQVLYCTAPPARQSLMLVFFYSDMCHLCQPVKPVFRDLSRVLMGCKFAMVNLSGNNVSIAKLSLETSSPIYGTPLVLLFLNGEPIHRYTGAYREDDLKRYVIEMSKQLRGGKSFSEPSGGGNGGPPTPTRNNNGGNNYTSAPKEEPKKGKDIPAYTVGIPYCDGDMCYISFDNAYGEKA